MAVSLNYGEHYSAFRITTMELNHSIPMPYNLQYLKVLGKIITCVLAFVA
jgi:hypothetical protein